MTLKLCFVVDTFQTHSQRWISYFVKKGHDVSVISTGRKCTQIPGARIHDIGRLPFIFQIFVVRRLLNQINPSIMHAHTLTRPGWLATLSNFHPFVLTAWGSDIFVEVRNSMLRQLLAGFALKRADLITSDSEMLRNEIIRLGGSATKNRIIHWGVDFNVFHSEVETHSLRKILGINDEMIAFSGRHFYPKYNITTIVKAIPLVVKKYDRIRFILKTRTKDLKYEMEIRQLIETLGVRQYVIFLGEVTTQELASYYNLSDIFISVPFSDSMSISVLEAMACKSVPVVSDLVSTREWIKPEVNGAIVPVGDHHALAKAILKLLSDKRLREQIMDNNHQLVREKGDKEYWMGKVEAYYEELCNNAGRNEVLSK